MDCFGRTKYASEYSKYSVAKEKIQIKMSEIRIECESRMIEYNISSIMDEVEKDPDLIIEKYIYQSGISARRLEKDGKRDNQTPTHLAITAKGIEDFKFCIDDGGEIIGVTKDELNDDTNKDSFTNLKDFEQQIGGQTGPQTPTPTPEPTASPDPTPTPEPTPIGVELSSLQFGDYVLYNNILCRVLYTASSSYGLQLISADNVESVSLGASQTFYAGSSGPYTAYNTSKSDYNDAINILITRAEAYLNTDFASDARCVGSIPTCTNGSFVSKRNKNSTSVSHGFSKWVGNSNINISGIQGSDDNYTTDFNTLKNTDLAPANKAFYFASRKTEVTSTATTGWIRTMNANGTWDVSNRGQIILDVNTNGVATCYRGNCGLRPVFCLKSNVFISGGNGEHDTPYTLWKT